jgi:Zn finger protein HypA/HybF involved in hydrogenase expression
MTEDIFESVISEQNCLNGAIAQAIEDIVHMPISFTRKTLYCPMCIYKMEITSPDDTYTCPSCGAWFDMLAYGNKYKIE